MLPCFLVKERRRGGRGCLHAISSFAFGSNSVFLFYFYFFNNIICRLEVVSCGEQIYTQMIQILLLVCGFYDLKVSLDSYVIIWS